MSDPLQHLLTSQGGFLNRTLAGLGALLDMSAAADDSARRGGLLQGLDARVKLGAAASLIGTAAWAARWEPIAGVVAVAALLALASNLPLGAIGKVWTSALFFTGLVALPAIVLTPGVELARVPWTNWPITEQGLRGAGFLVGRALASTAVCSVLMLSTPWNHLLKAMRLFRLPVVVVVLIGTTFRYIFLFVQLAMDMLESKRSRVAGPLPPPERRRMAIASAGVLMSKAFELNSEVHLAMQARGFRHEVRLLEEFSLRLRDYVALAVMALAGFAFLMVEP